MRVLHVIGSLAPRYGGPSFALPSMCKALAARGHEVEIMTTNIDGPNELPVSLGQPLIADGFTTTYFPVQRPRSYAMSVPLGRRLRSRVDNFDLVHVHSLYLFHTVAASRTCLRQGVPYVVRPHGTLNPINRAVRRWRKAVYDQLIERKTLRAAAAIHYTSFAEQRFAEEAGVATPGVVVPHGVDINEPAPLDDESFARRFPELEGRTLVTFLGRLTEKKGLDMLCAAFAVVARQFADAHLVVAGPDDEAIGSRMRARLASVGLAERASWPGLVTGAAKTALLQRSRAFVLPSRDESLGLAVLEALAAGTAVVISDGVGLHEEIAAAGAGLVVPRTSEAVADALRRLLGDGALARRLGDDGQELVRTSYSWEAIGEQLERLYHAVRAQKLINAGGGVG